MRKLLKKDKHNSRQYFNHNLRQIVKSKRSQGIMGLPFSMMFSIILIVFLMVAVFIGIRYFLDFQKQAQTGLFLEGLQSNIDQAWNSQSSSFTYNYSLPSGITNVCFVNLELDKSGGLSDVEKEVYDASKFSGRSQDTNFIIWPIEKSGDLAFKTLKHLELPEDNPYCIKVNQGIVSIGIEKDFGEALPRIRS